MEISNSRIDGGKAFDWGRTSEDYAKYRDIYPEIFYRKLADRRIGIAGQHALDIGTGTGVIPRNMYKYGARWTGTDLSPEQISEAKRLAEKDGMKIDFRVVPTEELDFPKETFDVITACQCYWYFDHKKVMPLLADFLKKDGKLVLLTMMWLPFEDEIARASEELVLKYSPNWSGAGEKRHCLRVPEEAFSYFDLEDHEEYAVKVPFTRESWHGRMRACRGIGASLAEEEIGKWEQEHRIMLTQMAPEQFDVLHYAACAILKKKS